MSERFEDERGVILDLLGPVDAVTQIYTRRGAVRGNHRHQHTTQWTYIVRGVLEVASRGDESEFPLKTVTTFRDGDLIIEAPGVWHAWKALTDCTVLVFTRGPRSGEHYEDDVERLPREKWLLS